MELQDQINRYVPLNALESTLKYLFLNNIPLDKIDYESKAFQRIVKPEKNLSQEETIRKFRKFISSTADDRYMTTDMYIPEGRNIYIRKFPRYLTDRIHHHKDALEINVVLQGEFYQKIGGRILRLYAGDICFVAPGVAHTTRACDDNTVSLSIMLYQHTIKNIIQHLQFADTPLLTFLTKIMVGGHYHPFLICNTGFDEDLLGMVIDLEKNQDTPGKFTDQYMITGVTMFILRLLMKYADQITLENDVARNSPDILNLMDYIEVNYDTVTLNSMARTFNYSPSHLSGLIKQQYGRSFKDIITDIRMEKAVTLLEKTDYSVTQIAEMAGYSDKCYFLRRFKEIYKETPSQYRAEKMA